MKMKTIGLTAACFLLAAAASFAADPMMGTWKLNEAKSKFPPGIGGKVTVVYEAAGNQVKVTADGTSLDGTPVHNEWTGNFDGKDYPVTGDPSSDARSYKRIDDHTVDLTIKKDGNVTFTGRCVISADGKSHSWSHSGHQKVHDRPGIRQGLDQKVEITAHPARMESSRLKTLSVPTGVGLPTTL